MLKNKKQKGAVMLFPIIIFTTFFVIGFLSSALAYKVLEMSS